MAASLMLEVVERTRPVSLRNGIKVCSEALEGGRDGFHPELNISYEVAGLFYSGAVGGRNGLVLRGRQASTWISACIVFDSPGCRVMALSATLAVSMQAKCCQPS